MFYLLSSLIFFTLSVVCHVILTRILLLFGKKSILSVSIFILGGLIYGIFSHLIVNQTHIQDKSYFFLPLPLSSFLLYLLFVLNYLIYFLSTYSGEESPSLKLYFLIKNSSGKTLREIVHEFPKKKMIDSRFESLEKGNFIQSKKNLYVILPRGVRLANMFKLYRKFLGWQSSG